MSLKSEIYNKIWDSLSNQQLHRVTYSNAGAMEVSEDTLTAGTLGLNTLGGAISSSKSMSATSRSLGISTWNWSAFLKFSSEIDEGELLEGLVLPTFTFEHTIISVSLSGTFEVRHPARQDSHNGTEITLGLIVTTRR